MRALPIAAALLALGLAGCSGAPADEPLSPAFGAAVASLDSQIIDPTPASDAGDRSGRASELALRRYQEHRIIEPIGAYDDTIFQRSGAADDAAERTRTPTRKAETGAPN